MWVAPGTTCSPTSRFRAFELGVQLPRGREHLLAAIDAHRRLGAVPWVALSRHAYAGVLRARAAPGDGERAGRLAGEARLAAESLGMRPLGGPLAFELPHPGTGSPAGG